ncbi:MAG TPA: SDR family oxidoreductase [Verrucomicrobiae bacterium]|nr:SDR family oxidoreductase [Verrucomicrobiae bacterium]
MRILILGGAGMLGHQLWRHLRPLHEVWVTLRRPAPAGLFEPGRMITAIDATNTQSLVSAFRAAKPDAVINCVGIIKQLKEAHHPLVSLTINSLLPHRLAELGAVAGARVLHISTDCVFSGRKGNYTEEDISDAEDLYGRTKFLGELHEAHCLTLRTSIIGRELETKSGLIEWFLSQQGKTIQGYRRAIYTGFTTLALARIIHQVLTNHKDLSGLWQVSSDPVNKYDLLCLAKKAFAWEGEILPNDSFICDRSLDSTRFREKTGFTPPAWESMLEELAAQPQ